MKILPDIKLNFSDVFIRPKRSELGSRSEVDLEREFVFRQSKKKWKGVPIIVSNMDTTGTIEMYRTISQYKMITCFHKFYQPEDYPLDMNPDYYMITSGIREHDWERLQKTIERLNPNFVCIDVANGYSSKLIDYIQKFRAKYPNITLMAGNVVTNEMTEELILQGVDIVKVGIGPGSCCLTASQSGCSLPQLSAIMETSDAAHGVNGCICGDGGVQNPGDFAKGFGAGADFMMAGSMFSGHDESGGDIVEEDGKKFKMFYGMSSKKAMEKHYGEMASYRSSEGKVVKVPYKGGVDVTVKNILGGIRSCMTYIGAKTMKNLSKCTTFIRVNRQLNNIYSHPGFHVNN